MAPRDTRSGSGPRSRGTHFGPRREARGPAQRLGAPRPTLRGPRGPCSEGRATPLPDLILGSVAAQPQGPRPAPRCAHRAAQLCAARCRCHGGGGRDRCSKPGSILQRKCVQRRVGFPLPRRSPFPAPARFSPAHCITRSPRCNGCISGFKTFALLRSRRLSESRRPSRHKCSQQPQKSAIKACCEGAGVARAGPSPAQPGLASCPASPSCLWLLQPAGSAGSTGAKSSEKLPHARRQARKPAPLSTPSRRASSPGSGRHASENCRRSRRRPQGEGGGGAGAMEVGAAAAVEGGGGRARKPSSAAGSGP